MQQPLPPDAREQHRVNAAGSLHRLLQQRCGVDAEAEAAVAPIRKRESAGQAVMDQGHHLGQIDQLQQALIPEDRTHVAHRAIAAVVLPGAVQIIEWLPTAEPLITLVILQPQQSSFPVLKAQLKGGMREQRHGFLAMGVQQTGSQR